MNKYVVTTSIPSPYDISILVLIYLHITEQERLPLSCFLQLISSSIIDSKTMTHQINCRVTFDTDQDPLLPQLNDIVECLEKYDGMDMTIFKLVQAMTKFDSIDQIIFLHEKICTQYRLQVNSLLGLFVNECNKKFEVSAFDDRKLLLDNMKYFLKQFMENSDWYKQYQSVLNNDSFKLNFFDEFESLSKKSSTSLSTNQDDSNDHNDPMVNLLKSLIKNKNLEGLLISETHLQNLINLQIQHIVEPDNVDVNKFNTLNKTFKQLSLGDVTTFPTIYLCNYLTHLNDKKYQHALDSLHSFYDYMLARKMNKEFHIVLFHLGLFHLYFNDKDSPMLAFQEALKLARENRDVTTLSFINLAKLTYVEYHPIAFTHCKHQVSKIILNLETYKYSNCATLFEGAYRAKTVLTLRTTNDLVELFESNFKFFVIAIQSEQSMQSWKSIFAFYSSIWKNMGLYKLGETYDSFHKKNKLDEEIDKCLNYFLEEVVDQHIDDIEIILLNLGLPTLIFEQEMKLKMINIKYLTFLQKFDTVNELLIEYGSIFPDKINDLFWSFKFTMEYCEMSLKAGMGQRAIPTIQKLIKQTQQNPDPLKNARCLIILFEILFNMDQPEKVYSLMKECLYVFIQFKETKQRAIRLFKNVIALTKEKLD